ncbi:MAG: CBS domain-containing protein, partial [Pseudomonadota bacterium]
MNAETQTDTGPSPDNAASTEPPEPLQPNRALVPFDSASGDEKSSVFSWLLRLFGRKKNGSTIREDLADALSDDEGLAQGFSPEERAMLTSILHLQDKRVEDIMVPRADIIAVSRDISFADLLKVFEESGHSRMPVYEETLDDPRGMVHIRDVLTTISKTSKLTRAEVAKRRRTLPGNLDLKKVDLSKPISSLKLLRDVMYVPPSMGAHELMARMQAE